MKLSNIKDWKTTTMAIVAGVIMLLGVFMPDKIDAETGETIKTAMNEILTGVGTLIAVITGILAKDK